MRTQTKALEYESNLEVIGFVRWDEDNAPVIRATINLYARETGELLGEGITEENGRFGIEFKDQAIAEQYLKSSSFYFVVTDQRGLILLSTEDAAVRLHQLAWQVNLRVPGRAQTDADRRRKQRPKIQVGNVLLDAEAVAKANPDLVLDIARAMVNPKGSDRVVKRIAALSPDFVPAEHLNHTLCGTDILVTIDELIKLKKWPREIGLEVDRILAMADYGFTTATYNCPNFSITYQDSGPAAVDPDTSSQNVIDPGGTTVLATLAAGAPPTYIKRVCFWLERALAAYISAPFSMLNPAAGGRIPVVINSSAFGSASPSGTFYLNNALAPDLLCAVAVHELFHMVQFQYSGSGTWSWSITEGGAVFAEDSAADLMNRYLDEAGTNFNGIGVMSNPNLSLSGAGYKCSLFWRYVAEQQSPLITPVDEPEIGVETYRKIIEACSAGSYSTNDVRNALRALPWYQDFYEFGYLDPARQDRTSSETTLGNYALACYLKDLGTSVPDRRFEFMEDEDNIYIDDVVRTVIPSAPLQTTLASAMLTGTGSVTPSAGVSFSGSVNILAHRYYEVTIDPAVTNIAVQFTAGAGLTSSLFQIALIDEDGLVRDIHRTDSATYSKRLTNLRAGKHLTKLALVVTGANSGGNFTVSAAPAAPAPDVMVTRWHSVIKTEYEIDSRNWAWTWVSPDIWVDNDADGVADGQIFFNSNNKLHIRLHNKGNTGATGIQVQFHYQDASGGLSDTAWLPVQNTSGVTQVLTGLSLPAGATKNWKVKWSPAPSGASHHFCIRAIVTVPGDPNTDNKRVLSNFGNVVMPFGGVVDIDWIRRNIHEQLLPITLRVVPRLTPNLEVSLRDVKANETLLLKPGESTRDLIRITHITSQKVIEHKHDDKEGRVQVRRLEWSPDPRGYYKPDPRTLPPGVAGMPMLTIVHEVDGLPLGGATFLVTVEKEKRKKRVQRSKSKRVKRQ